MVRREKEEGGEGWGREIGEMRRIASTFFPGESPRVDTVHPHDSTSYPVWAWSSRWRRKLFSREYTTRDIFEFGGGEAVTWTLPLRI